MIRTSLKAQFLVRSEPEYGESREGYMWRLCAENGHQLPQKVCQALARSAKYGCDVVDTATQDLIGPELDSKLRQKEAAVLASLKDAARSQWMGRTNLPRFCSSCIAQSPIHQFIWKLPLVEACPIHGCLLIDHCASCQTRFSWRNQDMSLGCSCGFPVSAMPSERARAWQVVLSNMIAGASDVESKVVSDGSYTLRDLYTGLNLAWSFRHFLTKPEIYPSQGWMVTQRKRVRSRPKAWEVGLLLQSTDQLWGRFEQLMQNRFAQSMDVLVQVRGDALLRLSLDCADDLKVQRNPVGRHVVWAMTGCLAELSANVQSMSDLCFNPCSDAAQRRAWRLMFERLVSCMLRVRQETRPLPLIGGGSMASTLEPWSYHPNDVAVMIINRLFEIAICGYSDDDIAAFTSRWRLPGKLDHSDNPLSDLAEHLRDLWPSEQLYVLSLADLVLHRIQGRRQVGR